MKKLLQTGGALLMGLAGLTLTTETALANDKPSADATVGLYSKYVWRGFELSKDSLVIQPSLTVGYKGFSTNFWSNVDTDLAPALRPASSDDAFNMDEVDLTLAYNYTLDKVDLTGGYIYYDLDGIPDSQEVFLSAGFDTILSPTLTVYREIAHAPGWYVSLGLSHSIPLKDKISLDLGASVSYWSFDNADDAPDPSNPSEPFSNFHDGLLSASVTFPINELISITPELYYSFPLSSDAADQIKAASVSGNDDNFVYGGVSASLSF
ncbi:MAG: hypothetical protein P8Y63_01905 [Deltaproteobacteria bacterium]|jgi:hypothetical protein